MHCEYSTFPQFNPVFQPFISRFSLRVVNVYEPPADAPANGYDALKSSPPTASGRHLFPRFLSRPLLRHKHDHAPPAAPAPLNTTQGESGRVM